MKIIAFWDNYLCERGCSIAVFDYAFFNQKLLNNKSIILYNKTIQQNNNSVIEKFKQHFDVYGLNNFSEVDELLKNNHCDILYVSKSGDNEGHYSKIIKTCIHCIFNCNEPHGNVYMSLSPYLVNYNINFPVLPFMINISSHERNMRKKLNIPDTSIIFGRHGASDTFDINYVHNIIYYIAKDFSTIYFLFVNTKPFCPSLPNIIHLEKIIDIDEKIEFINTCDAMIHGRSYGETFGLAIAEFSTRNKPVLSTKVEIGDNVHYKLLGDKGIWYTKETLYNILKNFNKEEIKSKDWNAYKDYTPEKVMKIFKEVVIES
jgi:hypothetical protein